MQQAKFSLSPSLIEFISNYKLYGFKDKSSMVQTALLRLREDIEQQDLERSADLYAEVYEEEVELQDLTEVAIMDWPE